jgi:hypothetical protein
MKEGKHHKQWRRQWRKVVRGGTTRLRKPKPTLPPGGSNMPPDESQSLVAPAVDDGVLRAKKSNHLPTALAEASEHDERARKSWLPGPLVGTITLLALAFIAVITWFIAQMPNK